MTQGQIFNIGDIGVTESEIVTPSGRAPLATAAFSLNDFTSISTKTPAWAIVLAIVLIPFTFLLSLFFLLAKTKITSGNAQIVVSSGPVVHTCMIPINDRVQVVDLRKRIDYLQQLVVRAQLQQP